MTYCRTNAKQILRENKHEEKQIKFKRRWLLGLPIRKSERKFNKILKIGYLSDSSYRKDDIFYESARSHVEGVFGAHNIERENCIHQDVTDLKEIPNLKGLILSCLDNFTTRGLYLLAMIVIGDTVKSVRTRGNLKKMIKGSLSSVLSSNNRNHHQLATCKQLFQLLTNPQHFRDGHKLFPVFRSQIYRSVVTKMLCRLQNLPTRSLIAMHRKLIGVKAPMPQLQPYKQGRSKDQLIKQVNKISKKMLLQLDERNELQEPLAKAMAIEELSLKLTTGFHKGFSEEFYQFSPDVKSLQNDIINAIWSIKKLVPISVLRDLQLLIDSTTTIPNRSVRGAFINLLTEYLFLCDDMDSTPKTLMQILNVINKGSNSSTRSVSFQEKYIEKEVDCIFSISAQTEQIILGLLSDNEFDPDFDDVYLEPLEDSDDSDNADDDDEDDSQLLEDKQFINRSSISMDSNNEKESIGDFTPFEFCTSENILSGPFTSREQLSSDCEKLQQPKNFGSSSENDPSGEANFCKKTEPEPLPTSTCKNQYLAIQESCDKTSMFAYNLIGHMLEQFATNEDLDLDFRGDKQIEEVKGSMADQRSEGGQPVALEKRSSGIVPIIKNVVSTVDLDCKLDLRSVKLQASNAEYNPQRFAAVTMRIRASKTTAYIFASGHMVCTGAQSEQQSKLAAKKYAAIIRKMGFPAKFKDFEILGIKASCDVKFPIWLEGLADSHSAFSSMDQGKPLIYQMKQPEMCLCIFESGKVILNGAKVRDEIYTAFENIYPVLTEFRKKQQ